MAKILNIQDKEERVQLYIVNRLSGLNKYQSAINAGYSDAMAKSAKTKIEDKISPLDWMEVAIPDTKLLSCLADGLNAFIIDCNGNKIPDFKSRKEFLKLAISIKKDAVNRSNSYKGINDDTFGLLDGKPPHSYH